MPLAEQILTIGHSNHTMAVFLELLAKHGIEVVVDVRSAPYSRYVPHFNKPSLEEALGQTPIKYLYLGRELGGRPDGREYYDEDGHALYARVAESRLFL